MVKITIRPTNICEPVIMDSVVTYLNVVELLEGIDEVDEVVVTKPSLRLTHSNNIHHIHFTRDETMYDIYLTEKQFKEMLPSFKRMGKIREVKL